MIFEQGIMNNVAVLMSSYNGALYIAEQIDSIFAQDGVEVRLIVRDDGSSDDTAAIVLDKKNSSYPRIDLVKGENLGPCRSFLELLYSYQPMKSHEYVAFSDQDDIWDSDKLSSAISRLEELHVPALYYSALKKIDFSNGISELVRSEHQLDFEESLIKSVFPGCTMVLNAEAVALIKRLDKPRNAIMHDWFVYQVLSGSGSRICYDETPHIRYRIHGDNYSVMKSGFSGRVQHVVNVLKQQKGKRYAAVKELYSAHAQFATRASTETLRLYASYRETLALRLRVVVSLNKTHLSIAEKVKYSISVLIGFF